MRHHRGAFSDHIICHHTIEISRCSAWNGACLNNAVRPESVLSRRCSELVGCGHNSCGVSWRSSSWRRWSSALLPTMLSSPSYIPAIGAVRRVGGTVGGTVGEQDMGTREYYSCRKSAHLFCYHLCVILLKEILVGDPGRLPLTSSASWEAIRPSKGNNTVRACGAGEAREEPLRKDVERIASYSKTGTWFPSCTEDEVEAESSNTILSFNCETNPTLSTLIEDEDSDESETSMDELALDYRPPPAKRSSSKSHWSHRRKRETGKSSSRRSGGAYRCSSAQGSTAVESWTFAEGRFHRFRGKTRVDSRSNHPRDVYNKDGWPNAEGSSGAFGSRMRPRITVRLADWRTGHCGC